MLPTPSPTRGYFGANAEIALSGVCTRKSPPLGVFGVVLTASDRISTASSGRTIGASSRVTHEHRFKAGRQTLMATWGVPTSSQSLAASTSTLITATGRGREARWRPLLNRSSKTHR